MNMTKRVGFHWSKMYEVVDGISDEYYPVIVTFYDHTAVVFHDKDEFRAWWEIHTNPLKSGFVYFDIQFEDMEPIIEEEE
jgi:ribosome-associated toxin RatA of RatAB toxin-antitoxin module